MNFRSSKMKALILLKETGAGREEVVETLEAVELGDDQHSLCCIWCHGPEHSLPPPLPRECKLWNDEAAFLFDLGLSVWAMGMVSAKFFSHRPTAPQRREEGGNQEEGWDFHWFPQVAKMGLNLQNDWTTASDCGLLFWNPSCGGGTPDFQ